MSVDDVLVTLAHSPRGQLRRISTGTGLCHREAAAQLTGQQGLHPPLLLKIVTAEREQLCVAGVRRVIAEDRRCEHALTEDLVHQAQLELTEPTAAELRLEMSRPQALVPNLLLELVGVLCEGRFAEVGDLQRDDLFTDEGPHPFELLRELRFV